MDDQPRTLPGGAGPTSGLKASRLTHLTTIASVAWAQVQYVWFDPQASLANKVCTSVAVLLALLFTDPRKHAFAVTIARSIAIVGSLVVAHLLTRGTAGTATAGLLSTAASVFASLPSALGAAPLAPGPGGEGVGPGGEGSGDGSGETGRAA